MIDDDKRAADDTWGGPAALEGGCFCGRLRYRVSGAPEAVHACHCRDCQRLTGSAFAINAVWPADRLETLGEAWGEREVSLDAEGSRAWRCTACGTLLFADHRLFPDQRFVRAGTLDQGERLTPTAHYFTRSKHPWIVIPDGVPAWTTLPRRDD